MPTNLVLVPLNVQSGKVMMRKNTGQPGQIRATSEFLTLDFHSANRSESSLAVVSLILCKVCSFGGTALWHGRRNSLDGIELLRTRSGREANLRSQQVTVRQRTQT